jgi:anaerobic selenocysteine-containing dehydrogenase
MFHAITYRPPAEIVDEAFPLWLTTGRMHAHYHTGTMTRNSPSLNAESHEGYVEINPQDAQKMAIRSGQMVKVASRRGEVATRAVLSESVDPGLVFMPFHYAEAAANVLTNPAHDPIVKIPEYKVCAVRLEAA